jgi:putative tricarboxylic transport membrane protein
MKTQTYKLGDLRKNPDIQEGVVFFILGIALAVYSLKNHYGTAKLEWKLSPYLFPFLISIFMGALSFSLIADGLYKMRTVGTSTHKGTPLWKRALMMFGISILYYLSLRLLTFIPATTLFLCASFVFLGEKRIWLIGVLSIATSGIIYVLFDVILHVMLP